MSAAAINGVGGSTTAAEGRDLVLVRDLEATPDKVYRAWTDPNLLTQWFTLASWKAVQAELDVRPGGSSLITMRGPDAAEFPNRDLYLEVVPNKKLVLTDAYTSAWVPSDQPFMTVTLTFDELPDGRTRYTARVSHWAVATARNTKKWVSTRTGRLRRSNSPRWWRACRRSGTWMRQ